MVFCETEPIGREIGFGRVFFEARPTRLGSRRCVWDFAEQSRCGSALGWFENNSLIVGYPACAEAERGRSARTWGPPHLAEFENGALFVTR